MTRISEDEFARIVDGIRDDRESIIKHNPIGTDEEILLWMLLAILTSYLNLTEQETPCLTGRPDAGTYREAIRFVMRERMADNFDLDQCLTQLC
ncbi:MAG: hypothetical protein JO314_08020 [Acidobacteria bacterium]|nr:hypothetical protein [Acidobacteriota bacterium]